MKYKLVTNENAFDMRSVEELFEQRKEDLCYNTSYPLKPSDWMRWKSELPLSFSEESDVSFYIHIPFCKSLCKFCEYIKFRITDEENERQYLKILDKDINRFVSDNRHLRLRGFDIGGGTPTSLSCESLNMLIGIMNDYTSRMTTSEDFFWKYGGLVFYYRQR